ncbi:MAG: flagellar hook-basal body complex protein FliE [Bacteriovoracaceae bacterium]|jgi:flagellar hook-basal body complex protein FliE|nr:flagellar hook-basal body complex protein FliE [Bacteriovoracaceae bacterium]|tara:strand:+ start:13 stop:372 length:360 start_codon:yes stop_codon:yes gene_type:complete
MAIHSVGQMASTLKNYNVDNWSKSVELGSKVDFRGDFPPMEEASESNQSFGDFLANSIAKVNGLQQDANVAMQKLASGESKNLHETLLAVEKADIAFKQMNQVRLKVIDAYKEIMKMQV